MSAVKNAYAFRQLEAEFHRLGIETDTFGFYDSEKFLHHEKSHPSFTEHYAQWVLLRPRDQEYDNHAYVIVPKLAALVSSALHVEGMEGGCVTAAGMISRILDRLGVWSFGVIGCLTLEVKERELWRGLATIDDPDFPGAVLGHAWVVAPPYKVVDASIKLQRWDLDPMGEFIPPIVLIENDGRRVKPNSSDVVSAQVRARYAAQGYSMADLHYQLEPHLREFGKIFTPLETTRGELRLRYVPVAIRQTDVPLELINSTGSAGRPAIELWRETIAPAFGL